MKADMIDDYPTPAYAEILIHLFGIYICHLQLLQIRY